MSRAVGKVGHAQRHHVEPVEQIAAEAPFGSLLFQVFLAGRNEPHIKFNGIVGTEPRNLPVLDGMQELGLKRLRQAVDLIEQHRAAAGMLELAVARPRRAGKAPASWPKSSLSISSAGSAAQLIRTNGASLRGLARCSARAATSLPVPVSPDDQDIGVGGRHGAHLTTQIDHHVAAPAKARLDRIAPADLAAQGTVFQRQAALVERAAHRFDKAAGRKRFFQEIIGAVAHRLDGRSTSPWPVTRMTRKGRVDVEAPAHQRQAVHALHADIGDENAGERFG
jgi:hypothetical protein